MTFKINVRSNGNLSLKIGKGFRFYSVSSRSESSLSWGSLEASASAFEDTIPHLQVTWRARG